MTVKSLPQKFYPAFREPRIVAVFTRIYPFNTMLKTPPYQLIRCKPGEYDYMLNTVYIRSASTNPGRRKQYGGGYYATVFTKCYVLSDVMLVANSFFSPAFVYQC